MRKWEIVATVRRTDIRTSAYSLSFDHLPITIGASVENDIVLHADQVSSRHAHLTMSRGKLHIHSSGRNGTIVDTRPVTDEIELDEGSIVLIAPFELQFTIVRADRDASGRVLAHATADGTSVAVDALPSAVHRPRIQTISVVRGPATIVGASWRLPRNGLRIGRSPTADLTIDSPGLSRLHADLRESAEGMWEIVDLQSANGTFLNGVRVLDSGFLRPGDEISLADEVTIRFDSIEADDSIPEPVGIRPAIIE